MRTTVRSALARSLRPAVVLALALLAVGFLLREAPEPPASDTDARIAWYQQRVGGPGTYPLYARLGLAYLQKARETGQSRFLAEAEKQFRTSLKFMPNYEALLGLGTVLAARHEFPEALRYAEEAAAAMPGSVEAQGLLLEIHMGLGDVERASAIVERMLSTGPSFAVLTRRAALAEYRGDVSGALEAIEQACRAAASESAPAGTRAWCEVRRGALRLGARCDANTAEQAYQEALRILPSYYFAREHLAELRAAQGRTAEAVAEYRDLLRDAPGPGYRLALADVLELEGKHNEAQALRAAANDEFWRAAETGSREHVTEHAVLLAELTSGVTDALEMIRKEWEARKDVHTATALARVYLMAGMPHEAEQAIGEALRTGTRNAGVLLTAAEIHQAGGRREAARRILEQLTACPAALTPGETHQFKSMLATVGSSR
jgi:tetratricopeptide (TPR) repeat protein